MRGQRTIAPIAATNPEYRLRNIRRQLADLLMGRRLSADPEATGIVDLSDFGKRCDKLADFAAESLEGLTDRCARRVVEEVELAARLAALMETLPRTATRIDKQCRQLEEVARLTDAAIDAEMALEETPQVASLSGLARAERDLFQPFREFEGRIEDAPPGTVDRGPICRALRRALLEHEEDRPFRLSVSKDNVLRFSDLEFRAEAAGEALPRVADEPPEVKKALDLYETAPDPGLRDFLLVKAVDEALFALLSPRLGEVALVEQARALPRKPGKRFHVRPEAVQRPVDGWDPVEAARAVEKLASRRIGPEWARLPRGAYVLRLFSSDDDGLAADLLALGPALRRMEKGEAVAGTGERAGRALRKVLGLLG